MKGKRGGQLNAPERKVTGMSPGTPGTAKPREKGRFSEESVLTALGRKDQLLSLAVRPDLENPLLVTVGFP